MSIVLSRVLKSYRTPDGGEAPVVDIDGFTVADAEQVAMIGTSGSGKTTLLHLIAGILVPDRGTIVIGGRDFPGVDIAALAEAKRDIFRGSRIGYIFQSHHLLAGFTARENVALGMAFTGRRADRGWAEHLLEEVGLSHRLDYRPDQLSIGQQQRVACARALANRPAVVLADEPTGALDARNAEQVMELIQRLSAEVGASLVVVSHDARVTARFPRTVSLSELNRAALSQVRP